MKGPSNGWYFSQMECYLRRSEIKLDPTAKKLVKDGIEWIQSMDGKLPPLDIIVEVAGDWADRGIVPADAALGGLVYIHGIKPYGPDYDVARMELLNSLLLGGE